MIQVTADDRSLLRDLRMFREPVEVLETNGEVVGLFVPMNLEQSKRLHDQKDSDIDWAEIERA